MAQPISQTMKFLFAGTILLAMVGVIIMTLVHAAPDREPDTIEFRAYLNGKRIDSTIPVVWQTAFHPMLLKDDGRYVALKLAPESMQEDMRSHQVGVVGLELGSITIERDHRGSMLILPFAYNDAAKRYLRVRPSFRMADIPGIRQRLSLRPSADHAEIQIDIPFSGQAATLGAMLDTPGIGLTPDVLWLGATWPPPGSTQAVASLVAATSAQGVDARDH